MFRDEFGKETYIPLNSAVKATTDCTTTVETANSDTTAKSPQSRTYEVQTVYVNGIANGEPVRLSCYVGVHGCVPLAKGQTYTAETVRPLDRPTH
jgi:hypothetical protein